MKSLVQLLSAAGHTATCLLLGTARSSVRNRSHCNETPFLSIMGRDSSVGIATRYGLDGPGIESHWEGEIFRTGPYRPWGQPSFLYNGYRVFPGVKRRVRGAEHPPQSKCRGHGRVGLYLYSRSGPQWSVLGRI